MLLVDASKLAAPGLCVVGAITEMNHVFLDGASPSEAEAVRSFGVPVTATSPAAGTRTA
jgi:DeoR/GlpR family transcriptional regulator of sugar metabolism